MSIEKIIEQKVNELVNEKAEQIINDKINALFNSKLNEYNNLIAKPIVDNITIDELIELFDTTTQSLITWREKYNINPLKKGARPLLFDRKSTLEILQNNGKRIKKKDIN